MPTVEAVAGWLQVHGYTRGDGQFDRIMAGEPPPDTSKRWDWHPRRDWIARRLTTLPFGAAPMTTDRPRLFVELCCGSAAVTLKLLGGRHAVPPISYMGSKTGYALTILGAMGLRSGIGADSVLLCDAGPWAHVLSVLADRERCGEVATILRGWADEEPRALWERLRAEHRGEWDGWTAERAAGWLTLGTWTFGRVADGTGFNRGTAYPTKKTENHHGGPPVTTRKLAHRLDAVAAWLCDGDWSHGNLPGEGGFNDNRTGSCDNRRPGNTGNIAQRLETSPRSNFSVYAGPAEDIDPPDDCEGVYVYMDPPYVGTTGYAATMPRDTVLATLQKWHDAGAVVCCSEAVGLADGLTGDWHEVDIAHARVGQKRTFSACQGEWITMNRPPQHKPATQQGFAFPPAPDPV